MLSLARAGELEDLKAIFEEPGAVPVDYQNESYSTALHYASANGHADCVEHLLRLGARHLPNSSGNTPLHWAVQNRQASAVRALLAAPPTAGVDVLQRNGFGKSALTDAFGLDRADITQLLLEHTSAAALDAPAAGAGAVVEEETDEAADGDDEDAAAPAAATAAAAGDGMEVEGAAAGSAGGGGGGGGVGADRMEA